MKYSLKQKIGAMIFDWPKYERRLYNSVNSLPNKSSWIEICNRHESLARSPTGPGVLCLWEWTSDLYAAKVFPSLGERLFKRALDEWPIGFKEKERASRHGQDKIDISFIIGHRGIHLLPHLITTIKSIAAQRNVIFECIVVEQATEVQVKEMLPHWIKYIHTSPPNPEMPYCRSWAFNVGASVAKGRLLVFHDNDICMPAHYGQELLKFFSQGYEVMRLQRFVFYIDKQTTEDLINGDSEIIKNIAAGVKGWAGDWDAVYDNILLRGKIKQEIVEMSDKLKMPSLLESKFNALANNAFHEMPQNLKVK